MTLSLKKELSPEKLAALGMAPNPASKPACPPKPVAAMKASKPANDAPAPSAPKLTPSGKPFLPPVDRAAKLARKDRARAMLAQLVATYPKSIGAFLPLKIGARVDIMVALSRESRTAISDALTMHTDHRAYLAAFAVDGAMRVDLDGVPVAPVTDEDRAHAAEKLAKSDAWFEKQRAKQKAAAEWRARKAKKEGGR